MTLQSYHSGLLFTQAHKLVRGRIYDVLEPYGLNPSYWSILGAALASPDGIRLASVAKTMNVKAPLITTLSNDLISMGLINRVPHHSDKRAKLLVVTAKGKKLSQEIEAKLNAEIGGMLQGLTNSETQTLQKAFETIIRNATKPA